MPRYVVADRITGEITGWGSCGTAVEDNSDATRVAIACTEKDHRDLLTAAQKRELPPNRVNPRTLEIEKAERAPKESEFVEDLYEDDLEPMNEFVEEPR